MKSSSASLILVFLLTTLVRAESPNAVKQPESVAPVPAQEGAMQNWRAARFGMFIHWGPVSLKGTEISWSRGKQVPAEEYDNLYKQFDPVKFNADEWVSVAKAAGMRYIVLTTKHHDGFCLWDTKQTDYNIMNSPFKRDVTKELAAACKRQGIAFGAYYSTCDWHHEDFPLTSSAEGRVRRATSNLDRYTDYLKAQITELINNYGPLWTLWFDVPQEFDAARGQSVINLARTLQPDIIINNRTGAKGDYDTPEQRIGGFNLDRPWETCMTICHQWSWKPGDKMKSLEQCLQTLICTNGGDGNLLLNVGPEPTGEIEPRQIDTLKKMGAWLQKYGETLYGTRGGPYHPTKQYASTRKGDIVYLHLMKWNGDVCELPPFNGEILESSLLTGGQVSVVNSKQALTVKVAKSDQQEIDTIVKLVVQGGAMSLAPIQPVIKIKATTSNVLKKDTRYGAFAAVDDNTETRWATDEDTQQAWLELDYGTPRTISGVIIEEATPARVNKFTLDYKDHGEWKTILTGQSFGGRFSPYHQAFPPVTAQFFRLNIIESKGGPSVAEISFEETKKP